jgi:hypothetical protein
MKEELLHAAWQFGLFDKHSLFTDEGEEVEILNPGIYNKNSGPDFFNGRIRLGGLQLAGNIEIHVKGDDWYAHGHQTDPAYENVVLHVVWEKGKPSKCGARSIPTVSIKDKVWPSAIENFNELMGSLGRIPCERRIHTIPDTLVRMWVARMTAERMEQKAENARQLVADLKFSPEQTFFILLAGNFGFHINREPFEEMAKGLDTKLFAKHKNSQFQIEALLFGRAGLLERDFTDAYPSELQKEFSFLRMKYNISPMNPASWKFGRTRPANFPTIRMAQLAALIFKSKFLMSAILEIESATALRQLFKAETSPYWESRYDFDKSSKKTNKSLSENSIDLLMVNTVAPFLFFSGVRSGEEGLKEKAFSILESVKPENNHITTIWREVGFSPRCAADSQGMIHLFRMYCAERLCLNCGIGNKLLSSAV